MRLALFALLLVLVPAASAAPQLRRTAVYVQNPTTSTLIFTYQAGGNDWRRYTIRPGQTWTLHSYAEHRIRFDNARRQTRQYVLRPGSTNYFLYTRGTLDLRHR